MPAAQAFVDAISIHPFTLIKGKLVPGEPRPGETEAGAIRTAERMAPRYDGVLAVALQIDRATGEVVAARELARHGEAPSLLDA